MVSTAVAVHVTGDLHPARGVGPDDFGQLFTDCGVPQRTGRYTDGTGGGSVSGRKGQIDIADPRRASPDRCPPGAACRHLAQASHRCIARIGDLVGAQPDRQFGAHRLDHRPIPWVKSHLRACGQAGITVENRAHSARSMAPVAGRLHRPKSGRIAPISSAVPSDRHCRRGHTSRAQDPAVSQVTH